MKAEQLRKLIIDNEIILTDEQEEQLTNLETLATVGKIALNCLTEQWDFDTSKFVDYLKSTNIYGQCGFCEVGNLDNGKCEHDGKSICPDHFCHNGKYEQVIF